MKPLKEQEPKLRVLRFRAALINLHMDLFKIDAEIIKNSAYHPPSLTMLEKLVLVLEDRRFIKHHGMDVISALREIIRALTFRKHGGASTIDMQLVRTITGYREKTLRRKVYEVLLAIIIQFRYSKTVILRSYLSIAFFGSHLTGASAAAKKMYSKSPEDLSLDEAAIVASMLVYPRPLKPKPDWESRINRRAVYGKRVYISNKERFDKLPC